MRVCVVGSSRHFLSGISYFTNQLASALCERYDVSVLLMRRLIPTALYPGRARVGQDLSAVTYPEGIPVFDGIDWFWGRTMLKGLRFLRSVRPDAVILQWWTGAVLHSYLLLAIMARVWGAKIVIEFHEVQDVGEEALPLVGRYVTFLLPLLLKMASGSVVHSDHDLRALKQRFGPQLGTVVTLPHPPYDFHQGLGQGTTEREEGVTNLLAFGVIRPFKGFDDLLSAFASLSPEEAARFRLTIVGETWEGFDIRPFVEANPHRDRIRFENRYVSDHELAGYLRDADVVVLPYHRSSSSGPLSVAMGVGLPVIVSAVGGLIEAVTGYDGAVLVPPRDPGRLRTALLEAELERGRRYPRPTSWRSATAQIADLLWNIGVR